MARRVTWQGRAQRLVRPLAAVATADTGRVIVDAVLLVLLALLLSADGM